MRNALFVLLMFCLGGFALGAGIGFMRLDPSFPNVIDWSVIILLGLITTIQYTLGLARILIKR